MARRRLGTKTGTTQFVLRLFALINTLVLFGLLCYITANWHVSSPWAYIATIIGLLIDTSELISLADKNRKIRTKWLRRLPNKYIITLDFFAFGFFFAAFWDVFFHIWLTSEYQESRDGNDPTKADVRGWRSGAAGVAWWLIMPEFSWHFIFLMINCIAICVRRKKAKRAMLNAHHDTATQTDADARSDSEELTDYQLEVIAVRAASKIPTTYFAPTAQATINQSK